MDYYGGTLWYYGGLARAVRRKSEESGNISLDAGSHALQGQILLGLAISSVVFHSFAGILALLLALPPRLPLR